MGSATASLLREMLLRVTCLLVSFWLLSTACACEEPLGGNVRNHAELNVAGVQALGKGQFEDALELFRKASEMEPQNPEYLNNLGVVELQRKKLSEAVQYFTRATIADSNYARAHYNLGVAYQGLNKDPLAVAAYKKTLELQPDAVEAYFNLGIVYARGGKKTEAIESYKKFIARAAPDYVRQIEDARKKIKELESK